MAVPGRLQHGGRPTNLDRALCTVFGTHAGELIAEGILAIEMGATAKDLAAVVHPHPTLSETLMEAAELFYGHATHAHAKKRTEA